MAAFADECKFFGNFTAVKCDALARRRWQPSGQMDGAGQVNAIVMNELQLERVVTVVAQMEQDSSLFSPCSLPF